MRLYVPVSRIDGVRRAWLWLMLTLWLVTQSWAWMHRVEHGHRLGSSPAIEALHQQHDHANESLHDGVECEWLDHVLLGSAAGPFAVDLLFVSPATNAPATTGAMLEMVRIALPYLARAPPVSLMPIPSQATG
jgi:hypothetical protein